MTNEIRTPQEGDLHCVVTIEDYTFELRYGYNEEYERGGDPFVLYPDLETEPIYTKDGYRIVSAIQSVCKHYKIPDGRVPEDCCYTCNHYSNEKDEVGICRCEKMRRKEKPVKDKFANGGMRT